VVSPLAPERYRVQLTITRETHDKLRRVQDLLRHSVPNGDAVEIFDRALTVLLEQLTMKKLAATDKPRTARSSTGGSRHIPAAVKRSVWARDAGRCAFIGTTGRCRETGFLEFHHLTPFAAGGHAVVENVELRCRA
jgi:5-methylcytosine-specific restriction endonuclease McrA